MGYLFRLKPEGSEYVETSAHPARTPVGGREGKTFRWREGQPFPISCHLFKVSKWEGSSPICACKYVSPGIPATHTIVHICDGVLPTEHSHTWGESACPLSLFSSPLPPPPQVYRSPRATLYTWRASCALEIHASLNNPGPTLSSGSLRGEIIFGRPVGYHRDILRKDPGPDLGSLRPLVATAAAPAAGFANLRACHFMAFCWSIMLFSESFKDSRLCTYVLSWEE